MYVPVIHARQSERQAIKNVADKIRSAKNVYPLVIPVQDNPLTPGSGLRGAAQLIAGFSKVEVPFAFLVTPYVQKVQATQTQLLDAIANLDSKNMATPVVAVTNGKAASTVEAEINLLPPGSFSILHVSAAPNVPKLLGLLSKYADRIQAHYFYADGCDEWYCDIWQGAFRVLIEDGFVRQDRNWDEHYSDLAFRYSMEGFQGYGDHTICGEKFFPGGGPARTVAIHLTYPAPLGGAAYSDVRIRHFLSASDAKSVGAAVCYFEALGDLVAFYNAHVQDLSFSRACQEFVGNLGPPPHFPQLGTVKRISIQHHIELMIHLKT